MYKYYPPNLHLDLISSSDIPQAFGGQIKNSLQGFVHDYPFWLPWTHPILIYVLHPVALHRVKIYLVVRYVEISFYWFIESNTMGENKNKVQMFN